MEIQIYTLYANGSKQYWINKEDESIYTGEAVTPNDSTRNIVTILLIGIAYQTTQYFPLFLAHMYMQARWYFDILIPILWVPIFFIVFSKLLKKLYINDASKIDVKKIETESKKLEVIRVARNRAIIFMILELIFVAILIFSGLLIKYSDNASFRLIYFIYSIVFAMTLVGIVYRIKMRQVIFKR